MRGIGKGKCLHLGVEDASLGLHHAHSAIEGLDGEKLALAVRQDGSDVQTEILGVHLGREAVADALLGIGRDLDAVTSGSQVTDCLALLLHSPQATTNEVHGDRVGLVIGESDERLGRVTVNELHTEDLRRGEGCLRTNSEGPVLLNLLSILSTRQWLVN